MFKRILIILITTLGLLTVPSSLAKEAKRYDDSVMWKQVVKVNFKIGKRADALKIIKEHFRPATAKAKTSPPELLLEMSTGDYDLLIVWHMKGGINDMTWDTSPDNIAWRKALNELSGDKDKAQKILDEYRGYVDSAESDIAMLRP